MSWRPLLLRNRAAPLAMAHAISALRIRPRCHAARASLPPRGMLYDRPPHPGFALVPCSWRFRCARKRRLAVALLLEIGENTSQEHDHALALGSRRSAPFPAVRTLVRDFELEATQSSRV